MSFRKASATPEELRKHVWDLGYHFGVGVVEITDPLLFPPEMARAERVAPHGREPVLRYIIVARIVDNRTYLIALHEMGHMVALNGVVDTKTRDDATKRVEEDAAHDWARHNALVWTEEMEQQVKWARSTYDEQPPPPPPFKPTFRTAPPKASLDDIFRKDKK